MKKQVVVALGLAVLATPAIASKARLQALGEDTNGSFFINDNRNIFLNAAEVNNQKDLVTFEFGTGGTTDADDAPNAEGGVLKAHNNLVYGLHLGRVTSFNETVSNASATAFNPSNAIDLFVGGDAGLKWGANLTYASGNDEKFSNGTGTSDAEGQTIDLNVGVIAGDISAYIQAGLVGEVEHKDSTAGANDIDFKRKSDFEIGAAYKLTDYTVFAQAGMAKFEEKESDADIKNNFYSLGVARTERLNDKTTMFVKLSGNYDMTDDEVANATDSETKTTTIPVSIGLEHDATSWLVLRGSVAQNIWSKVDSDANDKSTVANSTNVNAGATLKFGELSVDGVVGTNNGAGSISDTDNEKGTLALDNLMTRASVTYRF